MEYQVSHLLCFVFLCFTCLIEFSAAENGDSQVLRPLSPQDLDHSWVAKRFNDLTQLDPRKTETLLWGNPTNDSSSFVLANMTLYTGTGELIVSVDRFKPILKSVECGNKTVLIFNSNEALQYAIHAWNWVNENENHSFILVTSESGCGPDNERVPFYIYHVNYDEQNFVANLYGVEKSWDQAAHTFDLDYGMASIGSTPRARHRARGLGKWDVTKGLQVPVSTNMNGPLFSEPISGGSFNLDCVDCGTSGHFQITFSLKVELFIPKEVSITVSPRSVQVDLGLQIISNVPKSPVPISISLSKTIIDIPIPSLDFEIPIIGGLGFHFKVKAGIGAKHLEGETVINFGVTSHFADSAVAKIDVANINDHQFSGWTPIFGTKPFSLKEQISAEIDLYIQSTFGPQFTLFGKGFEAALVLKLPELEVALDQSNAAGSSCADQHKEGTSIDLSAGGAISLRAGKRGDLAITADVMNGPIFGKRSLELPSTKPPTLVMRNIEQRDVVQEEIAVEKRQLKSIERSLREGQNSRKVKKLATRNVAMSRNKRWGDLEMRSDLGQRVELVLYEPRGWHIWGTCLDGKKTPTESPPAATATKKAAETEPPSKSPKPPTTGPSDPSGSKSCKTTGDGLRYRICANTGVECPAMGEYAIGTTVEFTCQTPGEHINGDWATSSWGKTTKGYFVSLAYIAESCAKSLPAC